ncbi:DUF4352 domain-containing protein [Actinoplanes sp. NPDC049668]|uniref:DUF4352 domain-containing protein n=1 Tax=unclassified Actinoplanes TaxID=2626549 RepID=UPI0033A67F41
MIALALALAGIVAGVVRAVPGVPEPGGAAAPRGGKVLLRGDSREQMVVTMMSSENDVRIGSEPGHRLVTVTLWVENTGRASFRSDIEEHSWLVDRDDRAYGHNAELTNGKSPFASNLAPSWSVNRYVVFEVPADVDITRFRLSLDPRSSEQTADWLLH